MTRLQGGGSRSGDGHQDRGRRQSGSVRPGSWNPSRWVSDPDWTHIVKLIWWHQEEMKLEPISWEELLGQSEWNPHKFAEVMNRLLGDADSGIWQPSPGMFSYRW